MKKFLTVIIIFAVCFLFTVNVGAQYITTSPVTQSDTVTSEGHRDGYEENMVRGQDISTPIAACVVAACAIAVYCAVLIRKNKNDDLK